MRNFVSTRRRRHSIFPLNNPIQQSLTRLEPAEVFQEKAHEFFVLIDRATRNVAGDKTIRRAPQRMLRWQRLRFHHVEIGMRDLTGFQRRNQRRLVDGRAAAYVCRDLVCERPVTDAAALREALAR